MVYPRPELTVMRSQLRLRLERRTRTLGEPCLDLSPAKIGTVIGWRTAPSSEDTSRGGPEPLITCQRIVGEF